jgi:hypothetical protein
MDDLEFGVRVLVGYKNFHFFIMSRRALGPTQSPMQWLPGFISLGVKRLGREADHSRPTGTEMKNSWISTSTPPDVIMAYSLIS